MEETTNLPPIAAFSYTWNKEEANFNRLSRFIFGVGSFLKSALFCGHKVGLQEAVNLMLDGHQNAIFVRHSELSHYNIEPVDKQKANLTSSVTLSKTAGLSKPRVYMPCDHSSKLERTLSALKSLLGCFTQKEIVTFPREQLNDHIKSGSRGWLVVPCNNYSRIGADINAAIQSFGVNGIPENIKVIIVVVHLLSKYALPMTAPASNISDIESYSTRGNIEYIDLFFNDNGDLHNTKLNRQGKEKLKNALK